MKYPKEDYKIRKPVVSDPGNREDVIIFLSFYTLVIYHVFISRSNKRTSKLYTKLSILDSQQCPLNFYLISYVEDIAVFLGLKVFNSDNSFVSCNRNAQIIFKDNSRTIS